MFGDITNLQTTTDKNYFREKISIFIKIVEAVCKRFELAYSQADSADVSSFIRFGILDSENQIQFLPTLLKKDLLNRLYKSVATVEENAELFEPFLIQFDVEKRSKLQKEQEESNLPTIVDLFCGAGGLSLGFKQVGFKTLFANDMDSLCIETYKYNHPEIPEKNIVCGDIREICNEIDTYISEDVDVVIGGPPCQGFSSANKHHRVIDDPRNELYKYFLKAGQILPVVKKDDAGNEKVRYEFKPGPFTKILKKAYEDPKKSYYLVIEEINRGNAPAIFGEIFQLLDRMDEDKEGYKKGTSEYGITNENIALEVYGNADTKVRIPANLSILGTMNTSDQNVFTLDTAFQRRWIMRMIKNTFTNHRYAGNNILDTTVSWKQFCEAVNEEILRRNNVTSSEDKRLGAYFVSADDLVYVETGDNASAKQIIEAEHKNARFAEKVIKYLWDDAFKFSHPDTFDTRRYKSLEMVVEIFNSSKGNDRFKVYHENLRKLIIEGVDENNSVSEEDNE